MPGAVPCGANMFARPQRRRSPQRYAQRFPQPIPQRSPQGRAPLRAAGAAALLALLSACTTVIEPARPQARALPDTERPVTSPGATPRERIVEIATKEWARWGGQVVRLGRDDTSCVTYSPVPAPELPPELPLASPTDAAAPAVATTDTESKTNGNPPPAASCLSFPDGTGMEATPLGCTLARRYWGIVGETPSCRQVTQGAWAWSAVFVSWVLRKAGLDERQFLTGQSHSMYVVDARDGILPRPAFRIEPVPAMPRPGDIICAGRGRDRYLEDIAEIGFGTTPMHCDIVVAVDPAARVVRAIGGNVQQSVSMEEIELGDSGRLDGITNSHMPWLLVMRNDLQ
ncbi:conserved protein of unknown function [Cupriavidus taiwanensis]|uniref:DUF2272 domain-containing protein n=2 Tax=Cupriavidus taiwanensis TaxID=164546 RepID=A0A9Q7UUS5_9BURK|nr:conserved protein of unknown function [Cupriavidus taiwanensis]